MNPNNGLGDLYAKIQGLPADKKAEIEADIKAVYATRPALAMVDSDKGITNLHVPSDIIVDASMPVVVRESGKMWGPDGKLHDTKAMIPDRCYATIYKTIIEDCQKHGAFDPATMGSVPNVGLMAQKAEEYGSHDKTFIAPGAGTIRVVDESTGETLLEQKVEAGDIFRSCQTKDIAVRDWVKLAVRRARATGAPAVFWLDKNRAHDAQVIAKVETYLKDHDTTGLDIRILPPVEAMKYSLERIRKGQDTISVTGNVLRDYLTDLFPILEIGTSAKMLSIVPLLAGGGLFETGAGGSAPKHVQQFQKEGYLRWDSLGEFSALARLARAHRRHVPERAGGAAGRDARPGHRQVPRQQQVAGPQGGRDRQPRQPLLPGDVLGRGAGRAVEGQGAAGALRRRGEAAASRTRRRSTPSCSAAQGKPVDMGGYYQPDPVKTAKAMRPSPTLNAIIDALV